jgi:hypothetical protein
MTESNTTEYIDFYGYNKNTYEQLTLDVLECLTEYNPVLNTRPINYTDFGRCERAIWVTGLYADKEFEEKLERSLVAKGYKRFTDFNFYLHDRKHFLQSEFK